MNADSRDNEVVPTYRALLASTAVGYGILDAGATEPCASVDSLEKYWLALKARQEVGTLTVCGLKVKPAYRSVCGFGDGFQMLGLGEVSVPVVNGPLRCRHLNCTSIPGQTSDTDHHLWAWTLFEHSKGGVITDYKNHVSR